MSAPPIPYVLGYSFTDWATNFPSLPLPGDRVDTELRSLKTTTDQLISRLGEVQRDDGKLRNASVHKDALDSTTLAMLGSTAGTPRGSWITLTAYAVRDLVSQSLITYICVTAHTSGTFSTDLAAGKWLALNGVSSAAAVPVTPVGALASTDAQAAFAELDADLTAEATARSSADSTHAALTVVHGISAFGATLVDDADAATARATLVAAGTGVANTFTAAQAIQLTDAGATEGPVLTLDRLSASPAASDALGALHFDGRSSTAVTRTYASISSTILDPVNATEDAQLLIKAIVAGTLTTLAAWGPGLQIGSPTGGDKGAGTLNASAGLYDNGTRVLPPAYTNKFNSTAQTMIVLAGATTAVAHGLSQRPDSAVAVARCTTAEGGYSIGDEVEFPTYYQVWNGSSNIGAGAQVEWDATSVRVTIATGVSSLAFINKTTGATFSPTAANWSLFFRAWY